MIHRDGDVGKGDLQTVRDNLYPAGDCDDNVADLSAAV